MSERRASVVDGTRSVTIAAHAKINPILRVFDRGPDGYHRIETLFQRIALADSVFVGVTDRGCSLSVTWERIRPMPLGPEDRNLAWRAAAAYRDITGWPRGWDIQLTKRIPAGAGLGGGSSNAAAVLVALNTLAARPLDHSQLVRLGATLGADVGFFVTGASRAVGRGRGDQLTELAALPPAPVTLIVPGFPISTAEAYAELDVTRDGRGEPAVRSIIGDHDQLLDWREVAARCVNDFEPSTYTRYPELEECRNRLNRAGAAISLLSGSGSTVFGLWLPGEKAAGDVVVPPLARLVVTETA